METLSADPNLCFLEHPSTAYRDAAIVIIPAPLEKTVSFGRGAADGPKAILNASISLEDYDIISRKQPHLSGICTVSLPDFSTQPLSHALYHIEKQCLIAQTDNKHVIVLGGEHTVSLPAVNAAHRVHGDFTVLQIDAHTDLRDSYAGESVSHATVMRRVWEKGIPHVGVGIRSMSKEEADFVARHAIPIYYASDILACHTVLDQAMAAIKTENVYLSIDVDGLDPSVVPTTGTPEPGGLFWQHLTYLFRALYRAKKHIIGFDMVELAPHPFLLYPQVTCAQILLQAMATFFVNK